MSTLWRVFRIVVWDQALKTATVLATLVACVCFALGLGQATYDAMIVGLLLAALWRLDELHKDMLRRRARTDAMNDLIERTRREHGHSR